MVWEQLRTEVLQAATTVTVVLIGLASTFAVSYLRWAADRVRQEANRMQDRSKAELVWNAVQRLEDVAEKVVTKFEQPLAAELRQAVKEGRASRDDLAALGRRAYEEVLATVEPDVERILHETLGDFENYVRSVIEAQVWRVKKAA